MNIVINYKIDSYLPITQTWIYGQIKNLERYQPVVYAYSTENLDLFPTKKIRSLNLKPGFRNPYIFFNKAWNKLFGFYPSFLFFLMKDRPQLVHAHFGPAGYSFLRIKKFFKVPLITTFYGYDVSYLPSQDAKWKERYKRLFCEGERFLVEGNHMKKCLIDLGCPEEKIMVQHLGIDLDRIRFATRINDDNEIRVLISASFTEKKGIPYAIEAFGMVRRAHPELKLSLTIIGDSRGGPKEEEEKKKIFYAIQKYNMRDCVTLLGYQPHPVFLNELYNNHIFIHPSVHASDGDTEGGAPVSIIEASASGMPVLSTTHCDIPEVVLNGESGYLVPERDVNALKERLEFLITNPDIWAQLGRKGREHIEQNYNVVTQVKRLEEIYDEILENR